VRSRRRGALCTQQARGWPCSSPLPLRRLKPGRHVLKIRAVSPDGAQGRAATVRFRVLKGPRGR